MIAFTPAPSLCVRPRWTLMIHLFLDDSGKDGDQSNPFVCMAGYFGTNAAFEALHTQWGSKLVEHGITLVHMRELIPLKGIYRGLGWDEAKRDAATADFVEIIRKSSLHGVGVGVNVSDWRSFAADNPSLALKSAQEFCLGRILRRTIESIEAAGMEGTVAMVFDTDAEFAPSRLKLFAALQGHDERANRRLTSITFGRPFYYPGLQCADILAWETRKELVQRSGGHNSTKRWNALFAQMPDYELKYIGEYWDREMLDEALPQLTGTAASQKPIPSA